MRLALLLALGCAGAQTSDPDPDPASASASASASEAESESETEAEAEAEAEAGAGAGAEAESEAEAEPASECGDVPTHMACVHGGWFERGSTREDNEGSVARIFVRTFWMDRHEVTNALYAECVDAGVCEAPFPYREFRRPAQPVVAMHWRDADAYCRWRGQRLPTEAEWERAARGPDSTIFPWGDEPTPCVHANVKDNRGHGCGTETTHDVGSMPAGHWGLFDMAGNVDEWVADWYAPCYAGCPDECGEACAGEDPRGPCGGAAECPGRRLRVVRGGSWWWPITHATGTYRRGKPPVNAVHHRYGFRCAGDVGALSSSARPAPHAAPAPSAAPARSDG